MSAWARRVFQCVTSLEREKTYLSVSLQRSHFPTFLSFLFQCISIEEITLFGFFFSLNNETLFSLVSTHPKQINKKMWKLPSEYVIISTLEALKFKQNKKKKPLSHLPSLHGLRTLPSKNEENKIPLILLIKRTKAVLSYHKVYL